MPAICISVPFKRTFSMRGILAEKLFCRDRSYSTFDMQKKKTATRCWEWQCSITLDNIFPWFLMHVHSLQFMRINIYSLLKIFLKIKSFHKTWQINVVWVFLHVKRKFIWEWNKTYCFQKINSDTIHRFGQNVMRLTD